MPGSEDNPQPSFLVFAANHEGFGDLMFGVKTCQILREKYPNAKVTLISDPGSIGLIQRLMPDMDPRINLLQDDYLKDLAHADAEELKEAYEKYGITIDEETNKFKVNCIIQGPVFAINQVPWNLLAKEAIKTIFVPEYNLERASLRFDSEGPDEKTIAVIKGGIYKEAPTEANVQNGGIIVDLELSKTEKSAGVQDPKLEKTYLTAIGKHEVGRIGLCYCADKFPNYDSAALTLALSDTKENATFIACGNKENMEDQLLRNKELHESILQQGYTKIVYINLDEDPLSEQVIAENQGQGESERVYRIHYTKRIPNKDFKKIIAVADVVGGTGNQSASEIISARENIMIYSAQAFNAPFFNALLDAYKRFVSEEGAKIDIPIAEIAAQLSLYKKESNKTVQYKKIKDLFDQYGYSNIMEAFKQANKFIIENYSLNQTILDEIQKEPLPTLKFRATPHASKLEKIRKAEERERSAEFQREKKYKTFKDEGFFKGEIGEAKKIMFSEMLKFDEAYKAGVLESRAFQSNILNYLEAVQYIDEEIERYFNAVIICYLNLNDEEFRSQLLEMAGDHLFDLVNDNNFKLSAFMNFAEVDLDKKLVLEQIILKSIFDHSIEWDKSFDIDDLKGFITIDGLIETINQIEEDDIDEKLVSQIMGALDLKKLSEKDKKKIISSFSSPKSQVCFTDFFELQDAKQTTIIKNFEDKYPLFRLRQIVNEDGTQFYLDFKKRVTQSSYHDQIEMFDDSRGSYWIDDPSRDSGYAAVDLDVIGVHRSFMENVKINTINTTLSVEQISKDLGLGKGKSLQESGTPKSSLASEVVVDETQKTVTKKFADKQRFNLAKEKQALFDKVYDCPTLVDEGEYTLTMRYLGKNLEQHQVVDYKEMAKLFLNALDKIQLLHENGYFHLDVNLKNLVVDDNGKVSIIDFESIVAISSEKTIEEMRTSVRFQPDLVKAILPDKSQDAKIPKDVDIRLLLSAFQEYATTMQQDDFAFLLGQILKSESPIDLFELKSIVAVKFEVADLSQDLKDMTTTDLAHRLEEEIKKVPNQAAPPILLDSIENKVVSVQSLELYIQTLGASSSESNTQNIKLLATALVKSLRAEIRNSKQEELSRELQDTKRSGFPK